MHELYRGVPAEGSRGSMQVEAKIKIMKCRTLVHMYTSQRRMVRVKLKFASGGHSNRLLFLCYVQPQAKVGRYQRKN